MREIKFRAWDEREEKMIHGEKVSIFNEEDNGFHSGRLVADGDWLEMPLMQYTGLKDKNGKEIYKSDLVKDEHGFTKEIVWSSYEWRLKDHDVSYPISSYETYPGGSELEIIGNIYENPELLK